MKTVKRQTVIRKYDIDTCRATEGSWNSRPFTVEGVEYEPGTLQFTGFIGRGAGDGKLYYGHANFAVGVAPEDAVRVDFASLPEVSESQPVEGEDDGN